MVVHYPIVEKFDNKYFKNGSFEFVSREELREKNNFNVEYCGMIYVN